VTWTVALGSQVPVMVGVESVVLSGATTVGAVGGVVSTPETVVVAGGETVLPGVVCVAEATKPAGNGAARVQVHVPSAATMIGELVQVKLTGVMVEPGTPLPVTVVSVLFIGLTVGGRETEVLVALVTVVVAGGETLPAGSVCLAVMTVPAGRGAASVQL
jgi:hypothetical protein